MGCGMCNVLPDVEVINTKDRTVVVVFIHRKSYFDKCLHKLRQAGGRSAFAADRAETIIATLASAPGMPERFIDSRNLVSDVSTDVKSMILEPGIDSSMSKKQT